MPQAAPTLEPRDFALIDGAMRVLEATLLCRSHMAVTNRTLQELQRLIQRERDAISEKVARAEWREFKEQSGGLVRTLRRPA
jgi:hypothetical protein